jgi:transposase
MPECNAGTFQIYLDEFSKHNPEEFKIITLDNGAFHKAKSLLIPENMALVFLPPYSPELNPAENIWEVLKRDFTNKLHKSLDELSDFIVKETTKLSNQVVKSITSFGYIFSTVDWTI